MNINGGGLSFDFTASNDQLKRVIEESKQAITQFSVDGVKAGKDFGASFTEATKAFDAAFAKIDAIIGENQSEIAKLEGKYKALGEVMDKAFMSGNDKEFRNVSQQRKQIEAEIRLRKQLVAEAGKASDALVAEEQAMKKQAEAAQKAATTHTSLRTQLREVREALVEMEMAGQRGTEEYQRLQEEAGRLTDAWGDAQAQANVLAHDQAAMQGLISGLSGVSGAFSAAQGAVALFAGENENLQKIMLKVQSLMSITVGLQQIQQTLDKDSAFQLVTLAKAKEWWNNILAAGTGKTTADTAAQAANTAAQAASTAATGANTTAQTANTVATGAQAAAATAGTAANITLAGAFRMVGAAIKSIPVFGWIAAAIGAIIAVVTSFTSKAKKAREEAAKFGEAVAEAAVKPITSFYELQAEWLSLTDSLKEREKWVQNSGDKFRDLGFEVNSAKEAEELLVKNSAKVVEAFMLRAKAAATSELAVAKYKEAIKKQQEVDAMPDTKSVWVQTSMYGTGYFVETENTGKAKAQKEADNLKGEADALIQKQIQLSAQEKAILQEIGQGSAKIIEGSVEAVEQQITRLREAYSRAATDSERANIAAQLKAKEKELEKIAYKNGSGSGGGKETDAYADQLNKKKALYAKYLKWITSSDATVRAAANTEFAGLLKEGSSHLDYLEKQRADIEGKAKKTATDLKNLATLNDEIANATKETVLSDFDAQLQRELAQCNTIAERLALIEEKRQQLAGDNSDVDNAKGEMLNEAETETKEQAKQETKALLQEYAGYLQEKLEFEESYARKRGLLVTQAATAATEKERQIAEAALAALDAKRKEYEGQSGSESYDALLQEYRSYQQQTTDIQEKYEAQRAEAAKHGNMAMIAEINKAEKAALSKLATEQLMASESWSELFSDISKLSTKQINKLLDDINSKKIEWSAQFSPKDLQAINQQLEKAREEIHERNPFIALRDSLKELRETLKAEQLLGSDDPFVKGLQEKKKQYQQYTDAVASSDKTLAGASAEIYKDLLSEGTDYIDYLKRRIKELENLKISVGIDVKGEKELEVLNAALAQEQGAAKNKGAAYKEVFADIGGSIDMISTAFDSVVEGIKKMGVSMDEETETILSDVSNVISGVGSIASGVATGNPLQILQGAVQTIPAIVDLFNSQDRNARRSIKRHEDDIKKLGTAYNQLQHIVDNALGESVYAGQNEMIKNLRNQQAEIQGEIKDIKGMKKPDKNAIAELEEEYAELERQIADIYKDIAQGITGTSARDLAAEIQSALVGAFEAGEDAADAFGDVVDDVLGNAVANALKLKLLEEPLQQAINALVRDMGFNADGTGTFDGLTEEEQRAFREKVEGAAANYKDAMAVYKDLFEDIENPTSLSGAIKGASQESIDLLAGQTNAVRVNQVKNIELVREQLFYISRIDSNVAVISGRLLSILNKLTGNSDDLRAAGFTD